MDLLWKNGNCLPLCYCRTEDVTCMSYGPRSQHHVLSVLSTSRSSAGRRKCFPLTKITASSNLDDDIKGEKTSDSVEDPELDRKLKTASQLNGSKSSSSTRSPFIDGKISSHIAAKSAQADKSQSFASSPAPPILPFKRDYEPASSQRMTSSAAEELQNLRPRIFTDTKVPATGPVSKSILDAIRQSEIDGKTTKFGQPLVPTDLFNEPMSVPPESLKFEFTFNRSQILIILSFLTIISTMFGTAFLVWKVGAIHFNEL